MFAAEELESVAQPGRFSSLSRNHAVEFRFARKGINPFGSSRPVSYNCTSPAESRDSVLPEFPQ
jgi:hypothetical protein